MKKEKLNRRAAAMLFFFAAAMIGFLLLQTYDISARSQAANANADLGKSYSVSVDGPRGDILDENGNALVYNQQINILTFNYLKFPSVQSDRNRVISILIDYLENKNEKWKDELPIEFDQNGSVRFKEGKDAEIKRMKSAEMLEVNPYATAEDCFNVLIEKFKLDSYNDVKALKIASVCYGMMKDGFSSYRPYTFAEDISTRTVAYIKENSHIFCGVDGDVTSKRKYIGDGTLASHLLGVIGSISAEEYNAKKAQTDAALAADGMTDAKAEQINARSYTYNDQIGKNGIEAVMEDQLRGERGVKKVTVNSDGSTDEQYSVKPKQGNTVMLTINQQLQEIADASLKSRILAITDDEAIANGLTPAGAVVVQDVNSGAVLASSAYPNYSLTTYFDDYEELAQNPGKPLWNRAFQSAYSPGSTMKPLIAIAALEEGLISPTSGLVCQGTYQFYDQTFACFNSTAHGYVNVKTALEHSCNIFFYEMAKQLGIKKINKYAALFGLGEKTGIELTDVAGILAGPQYRETLGLSWQAGETLLAAIGQSDNSFTPIQLCNYCSTIANGGTRYVPYMIEKVISPDFSETTFKHETTIAAQTNISEETLQAVKEGMYLVANEGSCASTLGDLEYKVACKTGTAEKKRIIDGRVVEGTDGFLITFGPYEDAQIAITVVVENAGSGSSTAQVAADIYNYYFSTLTPDNSVQTENTLLH